MYIHCIFPDEAVKESVGQIAVISKVTSDKTFDTAVHWSTKNLDQNPDIIFCEEFAYNSQMDFESGKLNKDKLILKALKELRLNLPDSRIVILLHESRKSARNFLQYLISLGIYDFHFVASFDVEDLKYFLTAMPRNLRDVSEYVVEINLTPGDTKVNGPETLYKKEDNEEEKQEKSLSKLFGKVSEKLSSMKKSRDNILPVKTIPENTTYVAPKEIPALVNKAIKKKVKQDKIHNIYALNLETTDKRVLIFNDWDKLLTACSLVKPDIVLFTSETPDIDLKVNLLRENKDMRGLLIAVIGKIDSREHKADIDEYFSEWGEYALNKLNEKRISMQDATEEAMKDPLTGLYNKKYADTHVQTQYYFHKPEKAETKAYIVVGAANRVGATSFALAFASLLAKKHAVEILDTGGGAINWLGRNTDITIRCGPPFDIMPGVVTIVDAGTEIPEDIFPFVESVFLVTDLSRNAIHLKNYVKYNTYLVGNRGAPYNGLQELAELWGISIFCSLDEDAGVRKAEMDRATPMPRSWFKKLNKIL